MIDIADELIQWAVRGRDFVVATVVAVTGSAPRPPRAALAVDSDGTSPVLRSSSAAARACSWS